MSKDTFHAPTELEEALQTVNGVRAVLRKMVEVPSDESTIFALLSNDLSDAHDRAYKAFEALGKAGAP